ncbi:DedA family protein [Parasutterella sp.]|uniref:YqaA family protein n=1 Tax=Parasutterella sp. TaxID=2049037 RepID=UPI00307AEA61
MAGAQGLRFIILVLKTGALVTYGMGRLIPNKKQEVRSLELLKKYGPITLFFSWVPVVGDGFCLGAGWLRINFWLSFVLILIGKFARYLVLAAVSLQIFS